MEGCNMDFIALNHKCYEMKLKALEMALSTGKNGSHIGGGFSAMEIMVTLFEIADLSEEEDRDRIIVSKGHCVLALYTALWKHGFISDKELATFDKNGTHFHGHPHRDLSHHIEFSGGSLGLGMSYAVGVALSCKKKGLNNKVYVILGDGECDEGIVWESLMSAAAFHLDNLVIIVDRNKLQLDGPTKEVLNQYSLEDKFKAFGYTVDVVNGHSVEDLYHVLTLHRPMPRAIIANTNKANGLSFLQDRKESHQCSISEAQYEQAVKEIKEAYHEI